MDSCCALNFCFSNVTICRRSLECLTEGRCFWHSSFSIHEFDYWSFFRPQKRRPNVSVSAIKRPENPPPRRIKDLPRKPSTGPFTVTNGHFAERLSQEQMGMDLRHDQAIGQIVSAEANFKTVVVHRAGSHDFESGGTMSDDELLSTNNSLPTRAHVQPRVGRELLCVVRALLKKLKRKVMVGDRVLISGVDWVDGRGMIEEVFDRQTEVLDPPVANVDQMILLFALDRPKPEPISLSRFLVEAESTLIPFTLLFNKADLVSSMDMAKWKNRMLSWNYEPLFCSVNTRSGINDVVNVLSNKTSVIIGPSGVGKSSLINALGDAVGFKSTHQDSANMVERDNTVFKEQMVGEVSERNGRGKHTTRHVSLLKIPSGGYLADTPGFNQPGLTKVTSKTLGNFFPEIRSRLSKGSECAFSDCLHVGEPDCAVGGDWERYTHYLELLEELKQREQMEIRTFGTKKESDVRYKIRAMGIRQQEPRLDVKKHRCMSRQQGKQKLALEVAEEVDEVNSQL